MEVDPSSTCLFCKGVEKSAGQGIVHKRYCTPEFRQGAPRVTRSTLASTFGIKMTKRTPPGSPAPKGPGGAEATDTHTDTLTPPFLTPTDTQPDLRPTQRQPLDAADAQAVRDRNEYLEQLVKEQSDLIDIEQEKTRMAKERADALDSDLSVVAQERDHLRQTVGTPRSHPPVPGSIQALIDAQERRHKELIQVSPCFIIKVAYIQGRYILSYI